MLWLSALEDGDAVGWYLSDVSAAFDRVPVNRLLGKLIARGMHPRIIILLESWLGDREAVVVVKGAFSSNRVLANSVFQGTVWGPPLWKIFYQDARSAIIHQGFRDTVYADDLHAFRNFDLQQLNSEIFDTMREVQAELHDWGRANSVCFDPNKEEFVILHRTRSEGSSFNLLGVLFGP